MKLLVTRPEPDGARTAATLRARGHQVLLAPMSRIEPLSPDLGPGPWAAVLITSANAARALEIHLQRQELIGLPAIAVGRRSGQAARRAGFTDVISPDGTAKDMIDLAAALYGGSERPLLYLSGADRARDLVAELTAVAVPVEMRVIYRAEAAAELSRDVAGALRGGELDGVLHFSRRSAVIYLAAAARAEAYAPALTAVHYCLSERVAEPLAEAGAAAIRVAPRPTEDALLQLVASA